MIDWKLYFTFVLALMTAPFLRSLFVTIVAAIYRPREFYNGMIQAANGIQSGAVSHADIKESIEVTVHDSEDL